jgi:tRNA A58 N-methylase Trm61
MMIDAASLLLARQALDDFKQQHDVRVSELLDSNNAVLHRARDAEEKVRKAAEVMRILLDILPANALVELSARLNRNSGGQA